MRFITEFEIHMQATEEVGEFRKQWSENELGKMIIDAFNWNIATRNVTIDKYTVEIEAFPMDKWLEFKNRLSAALPDYDSVSRTRIINAMADLESFTGK